MSVAKTKKIEIEITEAQEKFLKEFAAKQYPDSDENLSTVCPIHVVQTRMERIVDPNYDSVDEIGYYNDDYGIGFDSLEELVEHYYDDEDINFKIIPFENAKYNDIIGANGESYHIYDKDDYIEAYGIKSNIDEYYIGYYYKDVAFFFIRDEAKEYMKYQGHNLTSPRIYTFGPGYSNYGDYVPFWNLLMSIGQKLNEVNGNDINEVSTQYEDNIVKENAF